MYDFFSIKQEYTSNGKCVIKPTFFINNIKDLMIKGGDFAAVWDENAKLWSTSEGKVIEIIDDALRNYYEEKKDSLNGNVSVMYMNLADTGTIDTFHKYVQKQLRDNFHELDSRIIFSNTVTEKNDYATKKLDYPLEPGNLDSYDELMRTLYSQDERDKLEWSIGAIISGDAKRLQKFIVLYGDPGFWQGNIFENNRETI